MRCEECRVEYVYPVMLVLRRLSRQVVCPVGRAHIKHVPEPTDVLPVGHPGTLLQVDHSCRGGRGERELGRDAGACYRGRLGRGCRGELWGGRLGRVH